MAGVIERKQAMSSGVQRFGSEVDVETIYGISRRTLQKHRLLGQGPRFYRFGRKVLYDLGEVEQHIRDHASIGGAPE
jgi:hypothetical protein